jgi:hypothetical protein
LIDLFVLKKIKRKKGNFQFKKKKKNECALLRQQVFDTYIIQHSQQLPGN